MAVWYRVEKTEKGITDFLDCNRGFRDYRPERLTGGAGDGITELFLQNETQTEGVLLRFIGTVRTEIRLNENDPDRRLYEARARIGENGAIVWIMEDDLRLEEENGEDEAPAGRIEAKELLWAVTDAEGVPVEMPADRIDQTLIDYSVTTHRHFDLTPVE